MSVPAAITTARDQLAADLIVSLGWDDTPESGFPVSPGSEIHANPDQVVFITVTPGPGYVTEEGGADAWAFQARVRGPADQPQAALAAAQLLDWMILQGPYPATVDGVPVLACTRMGSPPSALPLDEGDKRFEFTASYIITTGS
jgi:hypothetical protein